MVMSRFHPSRVKHFLMTLILCFLFFTWFSWTVIMEQRITGSKGRNSISEIYIDNFTQNENESFLHEASTSVSIE